jgi:hypothetical protein
MVQLIGLLICVYVFVRGLDIISRIEDRKSVTAKIIAAIAALIAIAAAMLFFWAFVATGTDISNQSAPTF